jgi:hypothetical protein
MSVDVEGQEEFDRRLAQEFPFSRPNPALALAKELAKDEFVVARQSPAFKTSRGCGCRVCTTLQKWEEALVLDTPEKMAVFTEIMNRLEAAETDATYYKMKYQGTWPGDKDGQ